MNKKFQYFLIDDDIWICEAWKYFFLDRGYELQTFLSLEEFKSLVKPEQKFENSVLFVDFHISKNFDDLILFIRELKQRGMSQYFVQTGFLSDPQLLDKLLPCPLAVLDKTADENLISTLRGFGVW